MSYVPPFLHIRFFAILLVWFVPPCFSPLSTLIAEDKGDEPVVLVITTDNPPSQLVVVVLLGGR